MAAVSTEVEKEEERGLGSPSIQAQLIAAHMGLNVAALTATLTSRPGMVIDLYNGDASAAATQMTAWTTSVGLLEFVLNPWCGWLSDSFGRKPCLLLSPVISVLLKLNAFRNPSLRNLALERIISGAATTLSGTTSSSSALSDICPTSTSLSLATAQLGTAAGLGVLLGPQLGNAIASRRGARQALLAGVAISAIQFVLVFATVKESNPPGKRPAESTKVVPAKQNNPLNFLQILTKDKGLCGLITVAAMQCCVEGKVISDMNTFYISVEAQMSDSQRSMWITLFGACMAIAGQVARSSIRVLGQRGHTTFSNFATIAGFLLLGSAATPVTVWGVLPFFLLSTERRSAVTALADKRAVAVGIGRGEFAGAFANLRAIVVAVAPMMYGYFYVKGKQLGRPGLGYWMGALIIALAELRHRALKDEEIGLA